VAGSEFKASLGKKVREPPAPNLTNKPGLVVYTCNPSYEEPNVHRRPAKAKS
jgi:hypothetical protein